MLVCLRTLIKWMFHLHLTIQTMTYQSNLEGTKQELHLLSACHLLFAVEYLFSSPLGNACISNDFGFRSLQNTQHPDLWKHQWKFNNPFKYSWISTRTSVNTRFLYMTCILLYQFIYTKIKIVTDECISVSFCSALNTTRFTRRQESKDTKFIFNSHL